MDPRLTPATDRVALAGSGIERPTLTEGTAMRVAVPLVEEDLVAGTDHRPVWVDIETTPLPEGAGTRTGE